MPCGPERSALGSGGGGMRPRGLWVLLLLVGLAQIALLVRGAAAEEDGDGGECGGPWSERGQGAGCVRVRWGVGWRRRP